MGTAFAIVPVPQSPPWTCFLSALVEPSVRISHPRLWFEIRPSLTRSRALAYSGAPGRRPPTASRPGSARISRTPPCATDTATGAAASSCARRSPFARSSAYPRSRCSCRIAGISQTVSAFPGTSCGAVRRRAGAVPVLGPTRRGLEWNSGTLHVPCFGATLALRPPPEHSLLPRLRVAIKDARLLRVSGAPLTRRYGAGRARRAA